MPRWCIAATAVAALAFCAAAVGQTPPPFLAAAEHLVDDLQQSAQQAPDPWPNVYGTNPSYIDWLGSQSVARTECSSFLTLLWKHTYGYTSATFHDWTGQNSPEAAVYHDAIEQQNDFVRITNIYDVRPGDVIAIVYYPEYQLPTGHMMLVAHVPQAHSSSNPIVTGTHQWTIDVIDSTNSYHGTTDTRYDHPGGIGRGVFRVYTDADGAFAGHTWSLLGTSLSSYYAQATSTDSGRHLVVGRLAKSIFASRFETP